MKESLKLAFFRSKETRFWQGGKEAKKRVRRVSADNNGQNKNNGMIFLYFLIPYNFSFDWFLKHKDAGFFRFYSKPPYC
jgi:hypothetical protein